MDNFSFPSSVTDLTDTSGTSFEMENPAEENKASLSIPTRSLTVFQTSQTQVLKSLVELDVHLAKGEKAKRQVLLNGKNLDIASLVAVAR